MPGGPGIENPRLYVGLGCTTPSCYPRRRFLEQDGKLERRPTRLSGAQVKEQSFPNVRAPAASSACSASGVRFCPPHLSESKQQGVSKSARPARDWTTLVPACAPQQIRGECRRHQLAHELRLGLRARHHRPAARRRHHRRSQRRSHPRAYAQLSRPGRPLPSASRDSARGRSRDRSWRSAGRNARAWRRSRSGLPG